MTTNWKGGDGDWQTAANWTNGAPTVPSAFAVINAAGPYTVTIGTGLEYHVGAVSLNAAGATLSVAGILDLTNKLTISKGTLALSGTIADGTIVAAGGTVKLQGATLDGMTYAGAINLSTNAASITVKDGLTLTDVKGTGLGALSLAGSSQINFMGDQTLHHGTFRIIGGAVNVTGILTFAGRMKILYSAKRSVFSAGASIVNQGSFSIGKKANFSPKNGLFSNSGRFIINGGAARLKSFSNQASGTVDLQSGSLFGVNALDNQGTITADTATLSLILADGGNFGTLDVSNSTVSLSVTSLDAVTGAIDQLAGHNNTLSVNLNIVNYGNTLTLSTPSGFKAFTYGGVIGGGTVKLETGFNGTLADLTAEGTLTTSQAIIDHVTFTGATGTGKGTIALDGTLQYGQRAGRVIPPLSNFDNVNIVAQAGSAMNVLGKQLILGAGLTLKANGAFSISFINVAPNSLINGGVLEADGGAGTAFIVTANQFSNEGIIRVENGGTFGVITHVAFQNFSAGTLFGGTYDIGAHSTFDANFVSQVNTLQATVALDGPGATFLGLAGLSTIGAQGALSLSGGATLSVSSAFTIDGALDLDSSSFTSANITIGSGGNVSGNGAVLGAVANSGLIDATGGTLSIGQDVTGTGQSKIEAGATLEFGSDASAGQTVTFESTTGTLALGNAGGFDGTIAEFAQGDTIDLINTKATAVTYDSGADTLTIRNKATVIATLSLSGDYTGDTFGLASDGNGGTAITLTGVVPGAVQRFTEARAAFPPTSIASMGSNLLPDGSLQSSQLAASAATHFGHA